MHLTTNPPSAPKRGKKSARKWDAGLRISPSKGGRFLACELRPIAPPTSRGQTFYSIFGQVGFMQGGESWILIHGIPPVSPPP